jgi:hypothetical protein
MMCPTKITENTETGHDDEDENNLEIDGTLISHTGGRQRLTSWHRASFLIPLWSFASEKRNLWKKITVITATQLIGFLLGLCCNH